MQKGLFYGKKGVTELFLILGEAVAAIITVFILFELGKYYASGDVVKTNFLTQDVALTIDSLLGAPYPTTTFYRVQGFEFDKQLELKDDKVTVSQGLLEKDYYFAPDLAVQVLLNKKFDIKAKTENIFMIGKNSDGLSADESVSLNNKYFCPGTVLPIKDAKVNLILDDNLKRSQSFFSGRSEVIFKANTKEVESIGSNIVILLKETQDKDFSEIISFRSENADSRRIACLIANNLIDNFQPNGVVITPGSDDSLDSVSKYPSVLVNVPAKSDPEKLRNSVFDALASIEGQK